MELSIGAIAWSSTRAVFKVLLIVGGGFFLAKSGFLNLETSRAISKVSFNLTLPCLLFASLVQACSMLGWGTIGIFSLMCCVHYAIWLPLAYAVRRLMPPPSNFRHGMIAALEWGNAGDFVLALIASVVSDNPLFTQQDAQEAIGLTAIYLAICCVGMLSWGQHLIELDSDMKTPSLVGSKPLAPLVHAHDNEETHNLIMDPVGDDMHFDDTDTAIVQLSITPPIDKAIIQRKNTDSGSHEMVQLVAASDPEQGVGSESEGRDGMSSHMADEEIHQQEQPPSAPTNGAQKEEAHQLHWHRLQSYGLPVVSSKSFQRLNGREQLWRIWKAIAIPPNIAVVAGLFVGSIPLLHDLFISSDSTAAPLKFVFDALYLMGNPTVPLGLMLVGATISSLSLWHPDLKPSITATVVMVRQVIQPMVGLGLVYLFAYVIPLPYMTLPTVQLCLVAQCCTPTGTFLILFSLWKGDGKYMANLLLFEYLALIPSCAILLFCTLAMISANSI